MRLNPFLRVTGLSATLGNPTELADWLGGVCYCNSDRRIPLEWKIVTFSDAKLKSEIAWDEIERNLKAAGQSLVFVQSRRRAEELAMNWKKTGCRVEFHHAGMYVQDRINVEQAFRSRQLEVLVATPTLEMGVNLPARQVVLYDIQTFDGSAFVPMKSNSVWQKAGRSPIAAVATCH